MKFTEFSQSLTEVEAKESLQEMFSIGEISIDSMEQDRTDAVINRAIHKVNAHLARFSNKVTTQPQHVFREIQTQLLTVGIVVPNFDFTSIDMGEEPYGEVELEAKLWPHGEGSDEDDQDAFEEITGDRLILLLSYNRDVTGHVTIEPYLTTEFELSAEVEEDAGLDPEEDLDDDDYDPEDLDEAAFSAKDVRDPATDPDPFSVGEPEPVEDPDGEPDLGEPEEPEDDDPEGESGENDTDPEAPETVDDDDEEEPEDVQEGRGGMQFDQDGQAFFASAARTSKGMVLTLDVSKGTNSLRFEYNPKTGQREDVKRLDNNMRPSASLKVANFPVDKELASKADKLAKRISKAGPAALVKGQTALTEDDVLSEAEKEAIEKKLKELNAE